MQQATLQGPGSAKGPPMTEREMISLNSQRGELKEQLGSLTRRRNQLMEQQQGTQSSEALRDFQQRIREIDQRASEIDRVLMRLDIAIANGLSQPLVRDQDARPRPVGVSSGQAATTETPPTPVSSPSADRVEFLLTSGALVALAGFAIWQGFKRFIAKPSPMSLEGQSRRLEQLQQSIDVIALEVERMSESQRYVAKVLNEKLPALGIGDAKDAAGLKR
jgi:hypothetical protein